MRDTPNTPAVLMQLERLAAAFGKPYDAKVKAMGEEYTAVFRRWGLPMTAVVEGVSACIATGHRFPPPAAIAEKAKPFVPKTDAQRNEQGFGGDSCPRCGYVWFWAGYELNGEVYPRARCGCPQTAEGWWTEKALEWTEKPEARMPARPNDYRTNRRYRVRQLQGNR